MTPDRLEPRVIPKLKNFGQRGVDPWPGGFSAREAGERQSRHIQYGQGVRSCFITNDTVSTVAWRLLGSIRGNCKVPDSSKKPQRTIYIYVSEDKVKNSDFDNF